MRTQGLASEAFIITALNALLAQKAFFAGNTILVVMWSLNALLFFFLTLARFSRDYL